MLEDITCPLWRRLLQLFQMMALNMSELTMTLLYIFKKVDYVALAISIHPIFHFTIFFSFHMEKKTGIWTFPCKMHMEIHSAPRKSLSFFCIPIGFIYVHPPQTESQNSFKGGRLFQQLVCDAWASIDQSNLIWAANNQTRLRADLYQGLRDCMGHDGHQDMNQVGKVILLSTHKGGTCYMQQLLQDSLAVCCEYRKPDLFLTMTANESWPEITQNLFPDVYLYFIFYPGLIICLTTHLRPNYYGQAWPGYQSLPC